MSIIQGKQISGSTASVSASYATSASYAVSASYVVGGSTFASDITVSLSGGKTLGKYTTGQVIPSSGKTAEQVLNLIGVEDIYPT